MSRIFSVRSERFIGFSFVAYVRGTSRTAFGYGRARVRSRHQRGAGRNDQFVATGVGSDVLVTPPFEPSLRRSRLAGVAGRGESLDNPCPPWKVGSILPQPRTSGGSPS